MSKAPIVKARIDANGTAQPLTAIVTHQQCKAAAAVLSWRFLTDVAYIERGCTIHDECKADREMAIRCIVSKTDRT